MTQFELYMMCDMFIIENYYPKWIVIMIHYMGNSHVVSYDHHCSLLFFLLVVPPFAKVRTLPLGASLELAPKLQTS